MQKVEAIRARVVIAAIVLFGLGCPITSAAAEVQASVVNNLVFGNVYPGIPKVVSKRTADSAAEFLVTGDVGAEVSIDFTLPTYMNAGGYNMPLIFKETYCAMDSSATPDQSNPDYDDLDPWHTITYRLGSTGQISIWLGGKVVPKLVQPAGSYTADIVLTVDYTGL